MNAEQILAPGNRLIIGTAFGDEGKGKGTSASDTDMYARGNGGNNAGHTFVGVQGEEINTHLLPSAINQPGKMNIIGPGTFVDPVGLLQEIRDIQGAGYPVTPRNLAISSLAHVTLPHHIVRDGLREATAQGQGSTKKGISYVASDKMRREGVRAVALVNEQNTAIHTMAYNGLRRWVITDHSKEYPVTQQLATREQAMEGADRFLAAVEELKPFIIDTTELIQDRLAQGQTLTGEGAQAFGLDINYGKYPDVTSSDTLITGLASGIGINHKQIGFAIGVAKAIQSKVGGGTMVTAETDPAIIKRMRGVPGSIGGEFGKSTGRARDVGYLDLVLLRAAVQANGLDAIILNKVDVLNVCEDSLKVAVAYELDGETITKLPADAAELARCKPVYHEFAPFNQNIDGETDYDKLPKTVRDYVEFSETFVGAHFAMLGTGPANHEVVLR